MRSNSGKDESRNNLCDPMMRDLAHKRSRRSKDSHAVAPADHRTGRKD
jgi:hypothetical protein